MRRFAAGLSVLSLLVAVATAEAQEWLKDRQSTEGPGIKVGDALVLHLGIGAEAGYDTNSLYQFDDPDQAVRLRITPFADLGTPRGSRAGQDTEGDVTAAPKAQFKLGVAASYDHHFPVGGANAAAVNQINGANAIGVMTDLQLVVFPEGKYSFLADLSYARTQQAFETSDDALRCRHDIGPGVGVRFRPGGGTLSIETGYRLRLTVFEDDSLAEQTNRHGHDVRVVTTWKMFPKTALLSRVNFTPTFYMGEASVKESSYPVRSLFGLQGLLLNRFGLLALVGYGASNYERGPNFSSVIAQVELMFFATPTATIRLGGERDFVDSFYANYYVKTGGYASYSQMFGGVFLATLKGDVSGRQYATYNRLAPEGNASPSHTDRVDVWIGATLTLEYRATAWLSIMASARYAGDITEFGYNYPDDPETPENEATFIESAFHKFEGFLGVKGHY
jgi:hypothetical protein